MSFTFNTTIPNANNDPSEDQPIMLQNNISNNAILAVDHISYNTANGGTHKYVQFKSIQAPGAPAGTESNIQVVAGVANTNPQLIFQNSNASFPVSLIRAYAVFTAVPAGSVTILNSYNVDSIVKNGAATTITVTLTADCTTGNNIGVLLNRSGLTIPGGDLTWSYANPTLTLSQSIGDSNMITFVVFQF